MSNKNKFVVLSVEVPCGKIKDMAIRERDVSSIIPLSIKNESLILMRNGEKIQIKNSPTEIFEKFGIINNKHEDGDDGDDGDDGE